ncbi:MAG TPA: DUF5063 domain-containing protein [Streptosporangiaceae bacterium]|nr:DUF5063 domain-containing protein [Streptosporangiaceae bacterium]
MSDEPDGARLSTKHQADGAVSAKPAKAAVPAKPAKAAQSAQPAKAAQPADGALPAEDWRPLADRIGGNARDFLDGLTAVARGESADETVPLLLLEVAQVMLAGAQLGASKDVILPSNWEPDIGADPDLALDALRIGLAERLSGFDDYAEIFDPYADTAATPFRLSDDLAAVAADLIHGLRHHEAGRIAEALWWWQYSYVNHWGTHGGAALRALHSVVAHARLDVAEEPAAR